MTERNRFVDTMKGILIIFVILLHSSVTPAERLHSGFPFWAEMAVPSFMFISGYVCYISFYRKNMTTFRVLYAPKGLFVRLLRFVIPFSIAYALEWIVFRIFGIYQVNIVVYGLRAAFLDYLKGGIGQGSYYFPIMIQFVLLFPLIFLAMKRNRNITLAAGFVINFAYEILKNVVGMSDYTYRLLLMRYLFIIVAGAYLAAAVCDSDNPVHSIKDLGTKRIILVLGSLICGAVAVLVISYTSYSPKIFTMWKTTSLPTVLYVFGVLTVLFLTFRKGFLPLEIIGKASFNIFLVQMIYYNFGDRMLEITGSNGLYVLTSVINCVLAGILFYYVESPLTKLITSKINKSGTKK